MREKVQKLIAALAVIFILPYIIVTLGAGDVKEAYALQKASENFITIRTEDGMREIAFEDYVCGVAARQLEGSCPLEAAKSQMVIARTNLKKFQEDHPGTLLSDPYLTLDEMEEKGILQEMLQAVEETGGEVLTFEDALVQLPFHAVSSGKTRSGEDAGLQEQYPWLTSVDSRKDIESEWYLCVELKEPEEVRACVEKEYPGALTQEPLQGQIEILARDGGDYVTKVRIGEKEISGEKFRNLLGLASSCFFLEENDGRIRITTKGLGHGLGLSRCGAVRMAEAGADYREILQYYFEKCVLRAE